jgi:NDP-sugar pyrophosphorylase family protein
MKAVILAAGQGTRLRPLTNNLPKCLVQVHGKPLLQYQLESLEKARIRHCVIVVGYLGDKVQWHFGPRFGNVRITYVTNEIFERTNNIYSLWLARHELNDDILLMEGDLLFDDGLLGDIIKNQHTNVAVVDNFHPPMNGTVILERNGLSTHMVLGSQQSADFDYRHALKTVNIYVLSRETLASQLLPSLDQYIDHGLTNEFYEAVMAQLIANGELQMAVHLTGNRMWTEIDTEEDLHQAERLLQSLLIDDNPRRIGVTTSTAPTTTTTTGSIQR